MTPLHHAAMHNHTEIVEYLLAKKGDVSARDAIGRNVLDVAIDSGHYRVCSAILRCEQQWRRSLMNEIRIVDYAGITKEQEELLDINVFEMQSRAANQQHERYTPLRRMIEKMPQLAKDVFDR